jgi:hypothetical protein
VDPVPSTIHKAAPPKDEQNDVNVPHPVPKRRPKSIVAAVRLLTQDSLEGKVALGTLGQYLKRTDPGFTPTGYGYAGLLEMIKNYDLLVLKKEDGGHYTVKLNQAPGPVVADA